MSTQLKDAPAFDFYPERWLAGVTIMRDTDQLAYLRLLCHSWILDGLPDDPQALKRLAMMRVSDVVLAKFPAGADGKRRNSMLETVRLGQRQRIAKRRLGAEMTNAKRNAERVAERPLSETLSAPQSVSPPPTTHHPPLPSEATHTPRTRTAGFPDSEEQARSIGVTVGIPPDYAAILWLEADGRDGRDLNGVLIGNFASFAKACWGRKQANGPRSKSSLNSSPVAPQRTRTEAREL